MNTNTPQIDKPILQFSYVSDAGPAQNVCSLDGLSGLTASCLDGFPTQAGTVALWVKTASTATDALLFAYNSPARLGSVVLQVNNPTDIELSLGSGSTGATGVAINDDLWHRLVVTFERASPQNFMVSLTKDGLEVYRSRNVISTDELGTGGDLYLGKSSSGSGLLGLVSELQVWNEVLSTSDIVTGQFRRAVDGSTGLVLHWGLDTAPAGNPNAVIVASDLRFRTGTGNMTWNAVTSATAYEIMAASTNGFWQTGNSNVSGTSYSFSGMPLSQRNGARVRALQGQQLGPWSDTVEITAFELGQTSVAFVWNDTAKTLNAAWPDVVQRDNFTLQLYQNAVLSSTTPNYTTLTYDMTSKLDDPAAWLLNVRAFALGSLGPAEPKPERP